LVEWLLALANKQQVTLHKSDYPCHQRTVLLKQLHLSLHWISLIIETADYIREKGKIVFNKEIHLNRSRNN